MSMNTINAKMYNDPKMIYRFVDKSVDDINQSILSLNKEGNNNFKGEVEDEKIYQILKELKEKISKVTHQLENNVEWQKFQIAFFGETNAGKSTIIETLRILLRENAKMRQQEQFKKLVSELDLSAEKFQQVKNDIENINAEIDNLVHKNQSVKNQQEMILLQLNTQKEQLNQELNHKITEYQNHYNKQLKAYQKKRDRLVAEIQDIKKNMSWWLKIIYIFIKLDEEKQLFALQKEIRDFEYRQDDGLEEIESEYQKNISDIEQEISLATYKYQEQLSVLTQKEKNLNEKKQPLQKYLDEFEIKKQQLLPFLDGKIMGDGRSDFTRESTFYDFDINNYPVSIIDVPGIEGKEAVVQDEILKAVQKAHTVFYVTSKDAAPNEGTLVRIRQYLNDQTEVWAIYNKQITNPKRQLNGNLIKGDDEKNSLNELECKLKEVLGDHYRGLVAVAGLPAFFSQATCIEPFSMMFDQQNKFLDHKGQDGLYEFSQLKLLQTKLQNEIVGNVPEKIKKSNFNKVKVLIDDSHGELTKIHETYSHYEQDLMKKITMANQSIRGNFQDFEIQVRGKLESLLNDFSRKVRERAYAQIDLNISNDSFKQRFDDIIKGEMVGFERKSKNAIEVLAKELESRIANVQKELIRQVDNLGDEYNQYYQIGGNGIALDFKIDNGIKTMGLLSVAIGTAVAMWWNPVGWFAISATVAGLVIAFAKSIAGFFSSNYKKEQQRKNVDSNLSKVTEKIRAEIKKSTQELSSNVHQMEKKIVHDLGVISKPIKKLNEDLSHSLKSLKEISYQIDTNR